MTEESTVVVNPSQVRDFVRATGRLAKADSLDAAVLAHLAEAVRPPVCPLRNADQPEHHSCRSVVPRCKEPNSGLTDALSSSSRLIPRGRGGNLSRWKQPTCASG